jgi:hypothetical protein
VGRSVGFLTGVADAELLGGDDGPLDDISGTWVGHHRQMRTIKGAALEQQDLSAAAFLSRCTDHPHRQPQFVSHCGKGHSSTYGGGGNHVMATSVTNTGKRLIFSTDHHMQGP